MKLANRFSSPQVARQQLDLSASYSPISIKTVEQSKSSPFHPSPVSILKQFEQQECVEESYSPLSIERVEQPQSQVSHGFLTPSCASSSSSLSVLKDDPLMARVSCLSPEEQLQFIGDLFSQYASQHKGLDVPKDFVKLALLGMEQLSATGKKNTIYALCKGLGTQRPDGSDSYFPTSRMPMGLLQHIVQFFVAKPGEHVCIHVL